MFTYTLGFYPGADSFDDAFHELKVHVKQSGLEVRYPKGYFALKDDASETQKRSNLIAVEQSPLGPSAAHLIPRSLASGEKDGYVPDSNLSSTGTHIVERFPVGRLKPGLDLPQLKPRFLPGISWECQQIVLGGPHPTNLFSSSTQLCIKCYAHPSVRVKILGEGLSPNVKRPKRYRSPVADCFESDPCELLVSKTAAQSGHVSNSPREPW